MNKTTESIITLNDRERKQKLINRLIAGAVLCVMIFTGLLGKAYNALFPTPTPLPDPAAQAVEAGVTAYATFEYNEDGNTDAWAERICAVSTELTCEYVKSQVAPEMVKAATLAKRGMSVLSAQALMKVDENTAEDIVQQIWAFKYSVDFWNGETVEKTDYVIVTQEDSVWKFENYVPLPQEILDQMFEPKVTSQRPTQKTLNPKGVSMNKITRKTSSIALTQILFSAPVIPAFAQDGTTSEPDWNNFFDPDTGTLLPGVTDGGKITIEYPEWMNTESGSVYNEASFHQYIAPNGDTIFALFTTTFNAMLTIPDESGFSAASGSCQSPMGFVSFFISLYEDASDFIKYSNQLQYDAIGNLTVRSGYNIDNKDLDKVRGFVFESLPKKFLGTYSEGSTGHTTSFWAAVTQVWNQAKTGAQDNMLAGTNLYYTAAYLDAA